MDRYIIGKGENISIVDNDQKVIFNITTKKLQDLLNQQDKHIKKLQEEIKKANINNYLADYWLVEKENQQLKEKLAEKDKEIEKLTEELDYKNFWNDFVDLYTGNKLKTQMLHENCKDKISFAVEQLEKVKQQLRRDVTITAPAKELEKIKKYLISIDDFIDNQIKQLKENK